jgi:chorismate-pyruvate lyase
MKARSGLPAALAALALLAASQPAPEAVEAAEAAAQVWSLNAELLSHDSATAVLQAWCDERRLAPGARITAQRQVGAAKPLPEAGRRALGAAQVRYRRVRLACGSRVLSEADNWYVPAALTPEMNRQLDRTDTPFGVAVRALDFDRRTLSAEVLLHPRAVAVPREVLRHSAVLTTATGVPFSYVVETYTRDAVTRASRTAPTPP